MGKDEQARYGWEVLKTRIAPTCLRAGIIAETNGMLGKTQNTLVWRCVLRNCVMVAPTTLTRIVLVRIRVPQPKDLLFAGLFSLGVV